MRTGVRVRSARMALMQPPPVDQLAGWLWGWPPSLPVRIVADPEPELPGWDGKPRGVVGVVDPEGRCVVRLPPATAARLEPSLPDVAALLAALPVAMKIPGTAGTGVLRWAQDVPSADVLPDVGRWLPASLAADGDPRVPAWLEPFGGEVLVALDDDDGRYLGGVGLKRHQQEIQEIAVVTAEHARGRGLARRLVAQAARHVVAQGQSLLYLHAPDNEASARVARASGFPDTGWQVVGFWSRTP